MFTVSRVSIFICSIIFVSGENCDKRYGDEDSFVCVCSDASCDSVGQVPRPSAGYYTLMTSSRDDFRFRVEEWAFATLNGTDDNIPVVNVNTTNVRQMLLGFGGAFTDATGINIRALTSDLQTTLIRHYYAPEGIQYNIGRVPIAGSDFSTHAYSYDDVAGDVELMFFSLAEEDYLYKIPYLQLAQEVSNSNLTFFASPWAPPSWMKVNGMANGTGGLIPEMQQPWANYFVKFFDAYQQESINFWGVTAQNEPTMGLVNNHAWNACGFSPQEQRDFVKLYLGPTLSASGYGYLSLMINDDSRDSVKLYSDTVLADSDAAKYVSGIAVHWYADDYLPATVLSDVHDAHPDQYLLYTEACFENLIGNDNAVKLGLWKHAEGYASDIIKNLNHWSSGWTDWNMALDLTGGPNWALNNVDAPVIVNSTANEFYKQPMFYALGHFSKFFAEGSFSLETDVTTPLGFRINDILATSFITPDNYIVAIVLSQRDDDQNIIIEDTTGNNILLTVPPRSIQTVVYALQ